jgi:dCMP deaminase
MTRDEFYQDLVFSLARRSTCKRAHVGAVLVLGKRVMGMGYNGPPPDYPHCIDKGCWGIGEPFHCRCSIHAEMNAIFNAALSDGGLSNTGEDLIMWTSLRPCIECLKACVAIGVNEVRYFEHREDPEASAFELYLMTHKLCQFRGYMKVEYVGH